MISYFILLFVLAGFAIIILLLKNVYVILRGGIQVPALRLDVLPASDISGTYKNQMTNRLVLVPDETGSVLRTQCALRIENVGNRPASKILLTFIFQKKQNSKDDTVSKIVVDYNREKQRYAKCMRCDVDVRDGYPIGYILWLDENLVIYPDPSDKRIVAELDLIVKDAQFEPDFEIQYRIQSLEGNRYLSMHKDRKTGLPKDQIYPVFLKRGNKAEQSV